MRRLIETGLTSVLLATLIPQSFGAEGGLREGEVRFNEHIRPILAEHCLQCHGPDAENREGDLRLDVEAAAKASSIVPGEPDESELFRRLVTDDDDLRMPPVDSGKTLTKQQVDLIQQWIREGAKYEGHWAFEPIQRPKPTATGDAQTTPIDRFILARLKQNGLSLSPAITKQQLIRRATFDLTGLPPTWEEVVAFVNDESPQAFETVINRLLESPRYGERWGRHWLDIARYADTHGGSAIGFTKFPFSYTYRDYVVRSLNADVPYDRFVTEQLAADQLGLEENDPALAGLGFLTVGMQFRNRHDTIDDQIDVVTRGLLGLTVACSRCHDHKFDPVSTEDYYSLYATLASSHAPDLLPLVGQPKDTPQLRSYEAQLAQRQIAYGDMAREQSEVMRNRLRMQVGLYLRELAKGTPEQDLSAAFLSYRTDDIRPLVLNYWRDYLKEMSGNDAVFGPWVRLRALPSDGFAAAVTQLVEELRKENGDLTKQPAPQNLGGEPPKWNPRVLDALAESQPQSLLDVADAYGRLFVTVQTEWLQGLLAASLEASAPDKVVPDEDGRHADINSAVNRQLRRHLYEPGTPTVIPDEIAVTLLNRTVRDKLRGRANSIHKLHLSSPGSPPRAMALVESEQPGEFRVFKRGNPIDRGDFVEARFISTLADDDAKPFPAGQRRLGLARAITDPQNPLTRRVIVNWVWQQHFGRGIVRTPDDFGTHGDPPTHPQLLDHLASVFLDDGWSLKKLHRRIMLTAAYRQGAVENSASRMVDPDNRLLWRMPRRRISMEAMRDSMLAVSGELDERIGGKPFDLLSKPVVPRRSIYAFINRDIVSSLASTFDAADPSSCTAKRPETTVPQQTLFALNSAFIQDRAAALTSLNEVANAADDEARIRLLYQRVYSRNPEPAEFRIAMQYVQSQEQDASGKVWQRLAHVLIASNEFVFVD
ncbi:MAG: DUF1553 domain-containing protein [Planctomycetota bacterium]